MIELIFILVIGHQNALYIDKMFCNNDKFRLLLYFSRIMITHSVKQQFSFNFRYVQVKSTLKLCDISIPICLLEAYHHIIHINKYDFSKLV